ncbi:MAG TPA: type 1 glutamine amidotransferase domain-containing protein, partial [Rhodospirillales bacterium]|nr:type 1 glutamine amidotransferase domain-containing protein [Rhodospirillales bacterium]
MPDKSLAGKKIAVLLESQYIPAEIKCYQERFASYGAEVHLMSYLWGQPKQTFVGEVEEAGKIPETIEVSVDFTTIKLDDYAAVIMAANYTSVRLRWNESAASSASPSDAVRQAPAVAFFRSAMLNRRIVKGAPCHALWLLTPSPDHLAGRRVTCNPVVLADVLNAGAFFVPAPAGSDWWAHVVVDNDLVTNTSAVHGGGPVGSERLVDAIRDQIIALAAQPLQPSAAAPAVPSSVGKRRILILLSEWGYWGEELVGPLGEFDRVGYQVDFCTPNGRRPNAIPVSMDPDFFDPPLYRSVTSREMAARTREIDDPSTSQGKRLDNPITLAAWFPRRPYFASPQFVRLLEDYNWDLEVAVRGIEKYDSLLIVGGSGPIVDLANNQRVHDLILAFLNAGKPVGAECYGVACLAFARDMNLRQSILRGKHVTGHCLEYDYQDGTAFVRARGEFLDFNMGPPPYPLEFILRDATGP